MQLRIMKQTRVQCLAAFCSISMCVWPTRTAWKGEQSHRPCSRPQEKSRAVLCVSKVLPNQRRVILLAEKQWVSCLFDCKVLQHMECTRSGLKIKPVLSSGTASQVSGSTARSWLINQSCCWWNKVIFHQHSGAILISFSSVPWAHLELCPDSEIICKKTSEPSKEPGKPYTGCQTRTAERQLGSGFIRGHKPWVCPLVGMPKVCQWQASDALEEIPHSDSSS